jgi:hypothetical protein
LRDAYNLESTPHIEIFDGNARPIAQNHGSDKDGLQFLKAWLASER